MEKINGRPLIWIGSSQEDLKKFPNEVKREMGYSLHVAQNGDKADNAIPLTGIVKKGRVFEVCDDHQGDTYRAVYTVKFEKAVYVLHAFKKKSPKGKETPRPDIKELKQITKTVTAVNNGDETMTSKTEEITVTESSGNVFADLGLKNPEELELKATIAVTTHPIKHNITYHITVKPSQIPYYPLSAPTFT